MITLQDELASYYHFTGGVALVIHIPFFLGISGKSQFLFAIVFTTRYLDIFTNFVSPYNTIMKVVFLITTYGTLYLIFIKFKATYDSNHDTFRAEFLVIPAAGLAVLVNHEFSVMEVRKKQCSIESNTG